MHDGLRQLVLDLAGSSGSAFDQVFAPRLRETLRSAVPGLDRIHIFAQFGEGMAPMLSGATEHSAPDFLRKVSVAHRGRMVRWAPPGAPTHEGVALPLGIPGSPRFTGHMFVSCHRSVVEDDLTTLRVAAETIAPAVYAELRYRRLLLDFGIYRHSIFGPVQGLASAAMMLLDVAAEPTGAHDLVTEIRQGLRRDTELLRMAQRNVNMLLSNDHVESRSSSWAEIIERATIQWSEIMKDADLDFRVQAEFRALGDTRFNEFAADILVSNLLHNALNYSYRNTVVLLGCMVNDGVVSVWVDNTGNPVPPHTTDFIRKATSGEIEPIIDRPHGVGIPLIMKILSNSGGTLELLEDTQTQRVTFTARLPA